MMTIIVVEADRLLRCAIAVYLKGQGYGMVEAADAKSARECLERETVQAILLDMYPEEQSMDLLRHIRSRSSLAHVPVVALIAASCNMEALDYLQPGDYLRIPFDMKHLDWLLRKLLAGPASVEHYPPNSEQPLSCQAPLPEQGASQPSDAWSFQQPSNDEAHDGA